MPGSETVLNNYLIVGALLFTLGLVGFLTRRNLIVMFLCAELMLQGVSLTLVAFGAYHGTWGGQVFAIFSLALAAAEAGIALALFVVIFKRGSSLDISIWQDLREADQPAIVDEPDVEAPPVEQQWPHLTVAGPLPRRTTEPKEARHDRPPAPVEIVSRRADALVNTLPSPPRGRGAGGEGGNS
ncbi:MAG: NADH-quinone oxidoreductase subunit NuoK [Planctomycetia bacterium]|nr:NADH-quinone oxidoreductase subunit NuoK [Planctomycetia bacterium]